MAPHTVESIHKKIGEEIGVSSWVEITQAMIGRFADLTDDHQFIHIDPIAAAQTPLGGTVAHGFLILSMMAKLLTAADFQLRGTAMVLNYGFEKVRFVSPVRAGRRIRGRFTLKDIVERSPGQWLSALHVVIEIENESKPAVIADWLGLQLVN
jgi:acyl dehydratase